MQFENAQRPIAGAAVTLVMWAVCVAGFLPPLNRYILPSLPLIILLGVSIAVTLILHLIFIGMAARRLGRSAGLWVGIGIIGMPVASIVGLIMFEWFSEERKQLA